MRTEPRVAATFLCWTCLRAVFHRGYVLTSGLYFVTGARLTAAQIVLLGAVVAATLTLTDIPAGAWSDAFSRKWPLAAGHGFLAAGMIMTGVVTAFPLLAVTQVLWGLGWACSGGADVAWLSDELDRPERIDRVLAARSRWELCGGGAGLASFGLIGWAAGLPAAIVASGIGVALLGIFVAIRFPEDNFRRNPQPKILIRNGFSLTRHDPQILLMLAATAAVNGADMIAWLFPRRLVELGLPGGPVLGYTAVGILSAAVGAAALRLVEARIDGAGAARRAYVAACLAGAGGLVLLAAAPGAVTGAVGVLLAGGVGAGVTRAVSVIWVNRRTSSDIRATVHSFLSQAETVGEILGGLTIAAVAGSASMAAAFGASAALMAFAAAIVSAPVLTARTQHP